jgi:septum formation protein
MKLVLASASPRRRRLLKKIARTFSVMPARIGERIRRGEGFARACVRLSEAKARAVARREAGAVVIGADTIAYMGKKIYRKTDSAAKARDNLAELSGRTHYVVTGVAVVFPGGRCVKYFMRASVRMKRLGGKALAGYLKGGEWKGRAGSYDISGKGRTLVERVRGERETVVGLPLRRLALVLKK